jgi:hypothetical protein
VEGPVPRHMQAALQAYGYRAASEHVDEMPVAIEEHAG